MIGPRAEKDGKRRGERGREEGGWRAGVRRGKRPMGCKACGGRGGAAGNWDSHGEARREDQGDRGRGRGRMERGSAKKAKGNGVRFCGRC